MTNPQDTNTNLRYLKAAAWFAAGTIVFALAYCQAPLYFSNQNQYFLHGAAQAGAGHLSEDWLAQTADPTPIFSFLVQFTLRNLHPWFFHAIFALIQGFYFLSLVGVFVHLSDSHKRWCTKLVFAAVLVLIHAAVIRSLSARWLGNDYPWYFQAGVAGQYVLGPILQPSVFGVFLLVSVWAFVAKKPIVAVLCLCFGATMHTTYLLSAALLTLSFMFVLWREKQTRLAITVAALALLLVLPILVYNFVTFQPSSSQSLTQANSILVHFRIPHHCIPRLWLDEIAAAQIIWIGIGVCLSWKSRLFAVMLIPFLIGSALTVVQVLSDSDLLALLFPWRISVILMPLATTVILTRMYELVSSKMIANSPQPKKFAIGAALVLVMAAVVGGIMIMSQRLAFQTRDREIALMEHVKKNARSGDVYLIPLRIPNLERTVRGSSKSDFRPLKKLQSNKQFIPLNLQRFRLLAEAPINVDFKSIPYQADDVIEWRRRIRRNQQWYGMISESPRVERCGLNAAQTANFWLLQESLLHVANMTILAQMLNEHKVTHIIVRADHSLPRPWFELTYEDDQYRIYKIRARNT